MPRRRSGCPVRSFLNAIEKQILGRSGQKRQEAFSGPGGRCRSVEAGRPQGFRPVLAQIDGDIDVPSGGVRAVGLKRRLLERQHLGLVEFVHCGPVRPRQPPGPSIQTRCQDHRLAHTGMGRREEELVENTVREAM